MSEGQAGAPGGVPQLHWLILLSCGHWLRMTGPPGYPEPADGEERTCGAVGHYPRKYAAFYIRTDGELDDVVDEALYAAGSLRTGPPPA